VLPFKDFDKPICSQLLKLYDDLSKGDKNFLTGAASPDAFRLANFGFSVDCVGN